MKEERGLQNQRSERLNRDGAVVIREAEGKIGNEEITQVEKSEKRRDGEEERMI